MLAGWRPRPSRRHRAYPGWLLVLGLLAGLGGVGLEAQGGAQPPELETFLEAARSRRTGQIAGRAYEEARTPAGPEHPVAEIQVALVPFSESLLTELDRRKALARASMAGYREAVPAIQKLLAAYVKAIRQAGGADLATVGTTAPDGTFHFSGVPQGRWLVVARRLLSGPRVPPSRRPRPREYVQGPVITGHSVVSFWLVPQEVRAESTVAVELTDRNVWYTGVLEETSPAAGR